MDPMRPFSLVRRLLDFAGRNGPLILLFGVLTGLVLPPLAALARPLVGLAVFCFTLGAFLKVDGPAFRAEAARPALLGLLLVWATLGVPLLVVLLARLAGTADDLAEGLI